MSAPGELSTTDLPASALDEVAPAPLCVSVARARQELGDVGRTFVYDLMAKGEIEGVRVGGRRVVLLASIRSYVDRQRQAPAS